MRWNWLPKYKGLREETRFLLGETSLNLSGEGEVYGYASCDGRGVISMRNPAARTQTYRADVADLLDSHWFNKIGG